VRLCCYWGIDGEQTLVEMGRMGVRAVDGRRRRSRGEGGYMMGMVQRIETMGLFGEQRLLERFHGWVRHGDWL